MTLDRRTLLGLSGYALAASLVPVRLALGAGEIEALRLIEPLGKPSIVWTVFDILVPALQQQLKAKVTAETIPGHDGFDAIHAALEAHEGETRLFASAVMGTQYAETIVKTDIRLEDLLPIAKLTNGFSVALFAKQGSPLKTWAELAAAATLLKVSSLERATAAYVAELMIERKGGLATQVTLRETIGEVVEDVTAGRTALGIIPTNLIAKQLDRLQPIVSFGAKRNAILNKTPTFAEVTGNPKLTFTESVGVFAAPKLAPGLATDLTNAFIAAGNDLDVADRVEAENIPLAINGPEVLTETMKYNERKLRRILG
jgi:tripartite-type tricarboxylate transporter receptor subunit TctC